MLVLQPLVADGRFVNPGPITRVAPPWGEEIGAEPTFRDFWRWRKMRPDHPETWHVPQAPLPATHSVPPAPSRGIAITWVGHSSLVLQIDGKTILLDPVWSQRIAGGVVRRYTPPGIPWSALPRIDALVLSHNHYDHLDAPTVKRLPRDTPVFCPSKLGAWFRARGFSRVTERSWWEAAPLDGHTLTCVPAQHFSGRTPWDRDRTLWAGWVVEGNAGGVAYFAGDSGMFRGFREIGERFARIDVAMIPVGAYEPRWFMSPVHVDPPEAGQAFLDTGARTMLPIHWGAFRLADEAVDEPARAIVRWWEKQGLDRSRLLVPALGETLLVS